MGDEVDGNINKISLTHELSVEIMLWVKEILYTILPVLIYGYMFDNKKVTK